MKKTITIEVPDGLPDGWECVGFGEPIPSETMHFYGNKWHDSSGYAGKYPEYLIARRVETATDWANKQPLFQWLAKMRGWRPTTLRHEDGKTWGMHGSDGDILMLELGEPTAFKPNPLLLKNGVWINA